MPSSEEDCEELLGTMAIPERLVPSLKAALAAPLSWRGGCPPPPGEASRGIAEGGVVLRWRSFESCGGPQGFEARQFVGRLLLQ
eukprot:2704414-Pyramimonas_sp.AAC.1